MDGEGEGEGELWGWVVEQLQMRWIDARCGDERGLLDMVPLLLAA